MTVILHLSKKLSYYSRRQETGKEKLAVIMYRQKFFITAVSRKEIKLLNFWIKPLIFLKRLMINYS